MAWAVKTWESKLFTMAKLSSNYNPSVVAFGKWQFLGDFTKEIVIYLPAHSSDTDSHFLCNTLKLFWVSFSIFFFKSILDKLILMRENYFNHLSVS